ncbi:MAG TPA: M56 family metallopeptidase [Vicinamibacterales bacterium]|nr:M56 family metallopeptidase [Vicinamibacterales bacterium]
MIRATIVLLIAHLIIPRLRRQSAAERHAIRAASLATAAVLPLLVLLMPSWQPEWARRVADVLPAAFDAIQPAAGGYGDFIVRATGVESSGWTVSGAIVLLWMLGSSVALLVLGREALKLRRLIASAQLVTDTRPLAIAAGVARSLGLTRPPRLLSSTRVAIPITWGTQRAHILLPDAARDWSDERVWAVLAHEMGHVRRGDWTTHLLAEIVCAIYWFHPLFWLGRSCLGRDSEQAADDIVLGLGANGADYASHLLAIVRAAGRRPTRLTPTVAMARRSDLERRVAALLSGFVNRSRVTRGHLIAIAVVAIVIALPLAAMPARAPSITIELRTTNLAPLVEAANVPERADGTRAPLHVRVLGEPLAAGQGTPPEIEAYTTPPLYSDDARRQGIEGVVTAQAHVDASGHLGGVRVVQGLGFGLDQNALVALRQWRFRPGTRGGAPVAMDVAIEIEFTLRSESINALIANDMATLVGPGVTPPKAVKVVQLKAGAAGVRGTVALDVVLLEDGTPRIVRILRSLTPEADESAVRAFALWRFSPAVKNGRPVKVRMSAEVNFHG